MGVTSKPLLIKVITNKKLASVATFLPTMAAASAYTTSYGNYEYVRT